MRDFYARIEKVDGGFRAQEFDFDGNTKRESEYEVRESEDRAIADVIQSHNTRSTAIFDMNGAQTSSERKLFVAVDHGVLRSDFPLSARDQRALRERNG